MFDPLNTELNPTCHLLVLLGAHPTFHISGLRVKPVCQYDISANKIKHYKIDFSRINPVVLSIILK